MTTEATSLQAYWDALNRHDWFYEFSDDQSVWDRGQREAGRLYGLRTTSPEHEKMWTDWNAHINAGIKQTADPPAKPERPEK